METCLVEVNNSESSWREMAPLGYLAQDTHNVDYGSRSMTAALKLVGSPLKVIEGF